MADRKRALKWILTAAAALGLVLLIVVFIQFRRQQDRYVVPLPDLAGQALMRLARLHQTATKDGKVQWELDAESARLEADSGRMILDSPVVDFYTDDGGKVLLTAEQGVLDTRSNDMEVRGNVRLHHDRYIFMTEVLVYQHARRILRSDVPVTIEGAGFGLRADTMTYDLEANRAQFDGQVEGDLYEDLAIR